MAYTRIGGSLGLALRQTGALGKLLGNNPEAAEMAAWTSCAAVSMFFSRRNCSVIWVWPMTLPEVSSVMPGTLLNCTSSGVATADAIVSALAPGRLALTWMVGKSTCGSGAMDSNGKATTPNSTAAAVSSTVGMG